MQSIHPMKKQKIDNQVFSPNSLTHLKLYIFSFNSNSLIFITNTSDLSPPIMLMI